MSNPPNVPTSHIAIKVGGVDLNDQLTYKLLYAEVDSTLHMPAMAVLRFHDDELTLVDATTFDLGKELQIDLPQFDADANASSVALTTVFKGEIVAVEPTYTEKFTVIYTVRAYDKSHRLSRETVSKVYLNVSDSDIVSQIASSAGLSPQAESTSTVFDHIFQDNLTHMAFLRQRAALYGYEVVVEDNKLCFRKPTTSTPVLTLEWGKSLRSFRPRLSLAGQVNEVTVKGWDPKTKGPVVGTAANSTSHPVTGFSSSGGALAESKISAAKRVEARSTIRLQDEATKLAQSILDGVNAGSLEAEGVAFGDARIQAGKKIELKKLGTKFSGKYIVTSAVHIYDSADGYDTHFHVEGRQPETMGALLVEPLSQARPPQIWSGVYPAVVTNNNTAEGNDVPDHGMVKVKFPWLDDNQESTWARVITLGAGAQRGFYWLPEVNDEVMVVFEQGDFNRPYVIGGVYNGNDAPPEAIASAVSGGKVDLRTIKTLSGHVVRFTDKSGSEKIEIIAKGEKEKFVIDVAAGTIAIDANKDITVTSATTKIELKAQTDVNITATSGNIKVEASAANVNVKGMNVNVEASTGLTLKGASVNVEASGPMTIKGAMVNIN